MIREVPTLYEAVLKIIARYPAKSLTKEKCAKLMEAIEKECFGPDRDIIQIIVTQIIDGGRMTDDALPPFVFQKRQELSLSNSKISGKYLVTATNFCGESLLRLDVSGCFQITNQILDQVFQQCPHIYKLNVKNCRKLTDGFLQDLVNNTGCELVELNVGGNFNITDKGIQSFLQGYHHTTQLLELSLSGLQISDETIIMIAKKCRSLVSLGCGYLDLKETTIQTLMNHLGHQLEVFDWSWPSTNPVVQNVQPSATFVVDILTTACTSLREVDLTGNRNLTLPHVIDLIERKLASATTDTKRFETLKVKFIATPKASLESNVVNIYTHLKILV